MSKESVAQSVHQRLLNERDKTGEEFNHLLMRYGLERLLYRLVAAGHGDQFVLKGALPFGRMFQDVRPEILICWGLVKSIMNA